MHRPETAQIILRQLQEATKRDRARHLLQVAYSSAVYEFETGGSPAVVRGILSGALRQCKTNLPLAGEMAVAVAILWRLGLMELYFRNRDESRGCLNRAVRMALDLGDANMLGVAHNAMGWYHAMQKDWRSARADFLRGLFQVAYEGAPKRLWSDLVLGLAWLEIHAPPRDRLGIVNIQKLLAACHAGLGGLSAYPTYAAGGGHLDPRRLSDLLWRRGVQHRRHSRHVPRWAREMLEASRAKGCSYCGSRRDLAMDHIFFYSWGGTTGSREALNLRWLCARCNSSRSDSFGEDDDAFARLMVIRST